MEEVDSNPYGWFKRIQDFSGRSTVDVVERTSNRSGTWRCDWIATISWQKLNGWGITFHGWKKCILEIFLERNTSLLLLFSCLIMSTVQCKYTFEHWEAKNFV